MPIFEMKLEADNHLLCVFTNLLLYYWQEWNCQTKIKTYTELSEHDWIHEGARTLPSYSREEGTQDFSTQIEYRIDQLIQELESLNKIISLN